MTELGNKTRKRTLYGSLAFLIIYISIVTFAGQPDNALHRNGLDMGMTLFGVVIIGVVLDSGIEAAVTVWMKTAAGEAPIP